MSNVKTSLYGHWLNEDSNTEYYISDGKIIKVDEEGETEKEYKVLEYDEVKNLIVIREKGEDGEGFISEIRYDTDKRNSVELLIDPSTFEFGDNNEETENPELDQVIEQAVKDVMPTKIIKENWEYVDDKQAP